MMPEPFVEGVCRWCRRHDNFLGGWSRLCIDCAAERSTDALVVRAVRSGRVEHIGPATPKAELLQFWRRRVSA
jgi:hypothetical protein